MKTLNYQKINNQSQSYFISSMFHDTEIFKYDPAQRTVILNNGGFERSRLIKRRMNECFRDQGIPAEVSIVKNEWIVRIATLKGIFEHKFFENLRIGFSLDQDDVYPPDD